MSDERRKHGHSQKGRVESQRADVLRAKALDLRIQGYSYRRIGDALKVSIGRAHSYVWDAMREVIALKQEKAEENIQLELERVDEVTQAFWLKMRNGDEKAADVVLKALDRRMKLLGLGTPSAKDDDMPPKTLEIELTDGAIKVTQHGIAPASHPEPGL